MSFGWSLFQGIDVLARIRFCFIDLLVRACDVVVRKSTARETNSVSLGCHVEGTYRNNPSTKSNQDYIPLFNGTEDSTASCTLSTISTTDLQTSTV